MPARLFPRIQFLAPRTGCVDVVLGSALPLPCMHVLARRVLLVLGPLGCASARAEISGHWTLQVTMQAKPPTEDALYHTIHK